MSCGGAFPAKIEFFAKKNDYLVPPPPPPLTPLPPPLIPLNIYAKKVLRVCSLLMRILHNNLRPDLLS